MVVVVPLLRPYLAGVSCYGMAKKGYQNAPDVDWFGGVLLMLMYMSQTLSQCRNTVFLLMNMRQACRRYTAGHV